MPRPPPATPSPSLSSHSPPRCSRGSRSPARRADVGPDGRYFCGSYCDNRLPSAVIGQAGPMHGRRCVSDRSYVGGPYHVYGDPYMTFWHMYSRDCQTTSVRARDDRAIGRTSCVIREYSYPRSGSYIHGAPHGCPAQGQTIDGYMLNDHDPQYLPINQGLLEERWPSNDGIEFTTRY